MINGRCSRSLPYQGEVWSPADNKLFKWKRKHGRKGKLPDHPEYFHDNPEEELDGHACHLEEKEEIRSRKKLFADNWVAPLRGWFVGRTIVVALHLCVLPTVQEEKLQNSGNNNIADFLKEQRFCYGGGEEEHGKQNFEAAVGTFGHKQHGGCPEQGWVSFLIYGKYLTNVGK